MHKKLFSVMPTNKSIRKLQEKNFRICFKYALIFFNVKNEIQYINCSSYLCALSIIDLLSYSRFLFLNCSNLIPWNFVNLLLIKIISFDSILKLNYQLLFLEYFFY